MLLDAMAHTKNIRVPESEKLQKGATSPKLSFTKVLVMAPKIIGLAFQGPK